MTPSLIALTGFLLNSSTNPLEPKTCPGLTPQNRPLPLLTKTYRFQQHFIRTDPFDTCGNKGRVAKGYTNKPPNTYHVFYRTVICPMPLDQQLSRLLATCLPTGLPQLSKVRAYSLLVGLKQTGPKTRPHAPQSPWPEHCGYMAA